MSASQRTVEELQADQQQQQHTLRRLENEHLTQLQEYSDLGEFSNDELEDELARIQTHTDQLRHSIIELTQQCIQGQEQKKRRTVTIQEFQSKRERLSELLKTESMSLRRVAQSSALIESQIKLCRDEGEGYQEDIYDLDLRADNLQKYGCEIVPIKISHLHQKKETLQERLKQMEGEIEIEQDFISKMVRKQEVEELQGKIAELGRRREEMSAMKEENEELQRANEQLNETKAEYEWNPNLQIKSLENNLQEQENRISLIEKDISTLNKKTAESLQKIQEYKKYISKQIKGQPNSQLDPYSERKEDPQPARRGKRGPKGETKKSIYDEIREDLEEDSQNSRESWFARIKSSCQGTTNKKFDEVDEVDDEVGDKSALAQGKIVVRPYFWAVLVAGFIALSYLKCYQK